MTTQPYTEFRQEYHSLIKVPKHETTYEENLGCRLQDISAEFYRHDLESPEESEATDSGNGNNGRQQHPRRIGRSKFNPPQVSVDYAAIRLNEFFSKIVETNTPTRGYAIGGGVALRSFDFTQRQTRDVDIYWVGNSRLFGRQALLCKRFILPHKWLADEGMTFFVKVGPEWNDPLQQNNLIKVDVVRGTLAPPRGFQAYTIDRQLQFNGLAYSVRVPNLMLLLETKLSAYAQRDALKDWDDASMMLDRYGPQIQAKQEESDKENWSWLGPWDRRTFLMSPPPNRTVPQRYIDFLCAQHLISPPSSSGGPS